MINGPKGFQNHVQGVVTLQKRKNRYINSINRTNERSKIVKTHLLIVRNAVKMTFTFDIDVILVIVNYFYASFYHISWLNIVRRRHAWTTIDRLYTIR